MVEQQTYARFLVVFASYVQPGEWISAGRLANRILPMASSEFSKEVSRKLSNLNRFGHLERRMHPERREHEYSRKPGTPITLPPELRTSFHFITLPDALLGEGPDGSGSARP
jgi:hypothetical protein